MSWGGPYHHDPVPTGPVHVTIHRNDPYSSWGFRLQGGRDYRQQLQIKKVNPGSPAHGRINAGDAILAIGGYDASNLTHAQASQMIKSAGTTLELTVQKGQFRSLKPTGPVKFSPGTAHQFGY